MLVRIDERSFNVCGAQPALLGIVVHQHHQLLATPCCAAELNHARAALHIGSRHEGKDHTRAFHIAVEVTDDLQVIHILPRNDETRECACRVSGTRQAQIVHRSH
eukprot:4605767-Prymnesium_polylepis.1